MTNNREIQTLQREKRKLRETMLSTRRNVPHALSAQSGQTVARHFADHPILAFAPSFAGYVAIRGEIDVLPIFDIMARFNKRTALPRITPDNELAFHQWRRGDALERNEALQLQEPLATAPFLHPAIVLVPLLAFDVDGYRLGYGGGYYDRTMTHCRAQANVPQFIGVAFSAQEIERVPTDDNDQPLDGILTEHGVSMF